MEAVEQPLGDGASVVAGFQNETFRLRSYQAEMVEESLKANIIVAMDTGSGKTHIALSRTAAELEACPPEKLVWFLAPTVTLCEQQFKVFQTNLPAYGSVVLLGKDNLELWTDQSIWDAVLSNVRIVVSTHQVLLDALTHAFVKMRRLALLIFDEAHHCISKHPANRIMANFYIPIIREHGGTQLPRILGLSASPVMKARASNIDLQTIEENLNSIAKSPKVHRSELIRFVHKPELLQKYYPPMPIQARMPPLVAALQQLHNNYDILKDPYVVDLSEKQRQGYDCSKQLQKVALSQSTYCSKQLKSMVEKAETMFEELGPSPTEWFLHQCISKFEKNTRTLDQQLLDWSNQEKQHLRKLFNTLPSLMNEGCPSMSLDGLSAKVEALVDVLVKEAGVGFTGLVFVEQRVWVTTLAEILATHPRTKDVFSIGTFVGTSSSTKRRANIADLAEPRNQQDTLDDFRSGTKNLILATSVLEEGIDVSSCHLVICFERPKNLKSFVQRRGRARKQKSKYIIFIPESGSKIRSPETWETLEEDMKKAYQNDRREIQQAEEKELQDEGEELYYRVPSTGALLTSGNASQHLHHFCSLLGSGPYIDSRPQFTFHEEEGSKISADVMLPISVDPAVRKAQSASSWETERAAKNGAAFEAYKALHLAGLVNDNMLPNRKEEDDETAEFQMPDHTPSLVEVSPPLDPWLEVARQQQSNPQAYYRLLLKVNVTGEQPLHMVLLTPCSMPEVPEFILHWNETKSFSVENSWLPGTVLSEEELFIMQSITWKTLYSIFYGRMHEVRYDFLWLLVPSDPTNSPWDHHRLETWNAQTDGVQPALNIINQDKHMASTWGFVSLHGDGRRYVLKSIDYDLAESPITGNVGPQLQVTRVPRRRDFLHQVAENHHENEAYSGIETLNAADCDVNKLPAPFSVFALFVPSILYKYEIFMIADTLRTTILKPISFDTSHLSLLVRAITSSATGEDDNYQRLEFLGDCILKFISSVHMMAAHLTWPESFLTGKKGKVVSNGFLARATKTAGLDKFILTKRFTGSKWAPRYASDVLNPDLAAKPLIKSSKLLADIVESLIGTSYIVGGFDKAFTCTQTLLPLEPWTPIPEANAILFSAAATDFEPSNLDILEQLVDYTFTKKTLLLEALTHASYTGPHANVRSYERLEFLGDAVLDYIISKRLYNHKPDLSHQKMHAIRTSMANASFLAFRMFETTIEQQRTNKATFEKESESRALWQFLRFTNAHLGISREEALKRHFSSRSQILEALRDDKKFPWHLLSLTDAPKFLSDIVESVIGAIYIDSHGSIPSCEVFVRRLGILEQFERILRDEVDCLHPKERLGHLAVERSVQYVKLESEEESKMYTVQVKVGGEDVGGPVEGLKRLNAETIAAWKAVRIMESENEGDVWHDAEEGGGMLLDVE